VGECGRLDSEKRVPALDRVLPEELELCVVFVDVILLEPVGQPADHEEVPIPRADSPGPVKDLLRLVLRHQRQIGRVVHVGPRIGVPGRVVEFPEIHRHIQPAVEMAQIPVMIGHGHFLQHHPRAVSLHERRRKAPVNRFRIHAHPLQVMRVRSFAGDIVKVGGGRNGTGEESRGSCQNHSGFHE
jgi:hypothetical protein